MPISPEALQRLYRVRFEESRYDEAVDKVMVELENHVRFCRYVPLGEMSWRVSSRAKDLETIIEKVDRGHRRPLITTLSDLEAKVGDIAGARVVLDRIDQVKETGEFIEQHRDWEVVRIQRKRRGDTGYRSLHIDVKLNTTHHENVRCEIQCRTLLELSTPA